MLSAEDCRQHANECVELAQAVGEPEKPKLLKLALDWLTLADQPLPDEEAYRLNPSVGQGPPASPRTVA